MVVYLALNNGRAELFGRYSSETVEVVHVAVPEVKWSLSEVLYVADFFTPFPGFKLQYKYFPLQTIKWKRWKILASFLLQSTCDLD